MDDKSPDQAPAADVWRVERRVDAILLKVLDGIERAIDEGKLSPLEAYETLCRAEAARRG